MKRVVQTLLQSLEAVEAEYDGLGDTNVRDHMGDHLLRGFLRPEPGFVASGEYGLDPEANRKVADALSAFCTAAEVEAQRLGLSTFEQRVAAFQDVDVVTASGANYNDYFGAIELEQGDSREKQLGTSSTSKPVQRAFVFDRPGSLEALLEAFRQQGSWAWQTAGGGAEDPFLEAQPEAGARVRVREEFENMDADGSVSPPEHGFMALLEAEPRRIDAVSAAFLKSLGQAAATNVGETSDYWW